MKTILAILLWFAGTNGHAINEKEIRDIYYKSYNYEKMENYSDAIRVVLPVYQHYPGGYTINLRLGWLYYLNKNYANSLAHYEKAIKAAPVSLEAKLGHILPLIAQERYPEIEKETFQILNTDYYNYYGNLHLIYALRMQKKYDSAEKVALKMLAMYPIDISFLTEYALLKYARKEVDGALKIFYDILILDPENITAKQYVKN